MSRTSPLQLVCGACNALNRVSAFKLADNPLCGKCRDNLLTTSPVSLDDSNFERWVGKSDLPILVDFWAPWCGPCLQFAPVFANTAASMATRVSFVKLDTQANPITAQRLQIRSIPTLILFHRAKEVARLSGAQPQAQLMQWLQQHLPSEV